MKNLKDIFEALVRNNSSISEALVKGNTNQTTNNNYKFVDLGLKSKTLWANKNIGAKDEYDIGNYYGWGELDADIKNKEKYKWYNYKWGDDSVLMRNAKTTYSSYNLYKKDDVAFMTIKDGAHMPTQKECQELIDNTTVEFIENKFDKYAKFTSKHNDKYIIIPLGGIVDENNGSDWAWHRQSTGAIWTSESYTKNCNEPKDAITANNLCFLINHNDKVLIGHSRKDQGLNIRAVK